MPRCSASWKPCHANRTMQLRERASGRDRIIVNWIVVKEQITLLACQVKRPPGNYTVEKAWKCCRTYHLLALLVDSTPTIQMMESTESLYTVPSCGACVAILWQAWIYPLNTLQPVSSSPRVLRRAWRRYRDLCSQNAYFGVHWGR